MGIAGGDGQEREIDLAHEGGVDDGVVRHGQRHARVGSGAGNDGREMVGAEMEIWRGGT